MRNENAHHDTTAASRSPNNPQERSAAHGSFEEVLWSVSINEQRDA